MNEIKAYNGGMNDAARLTDFTRHNAEHMIFYRSWMRLTDYKKIGQFTYRSNRTSNKLMQVQRFTKVLRHFWQFP